MKVIFAAAEVAPIAKVGGLADVVGSLPKALKKLGIDVAIIIPKYGNFEGKKFPAKILWDDLEIFFNHKIENFSVWQTFLPATQIPIFLIENPILSSNGVYLSPDATPKGLTEVSRFAFFSEAVTQLLDEKFPNFDIIHCHDWHTAIIPDLIKVKFLPPHKLSKAAIVLTIHNLGTSYQGATDPAILHVLDLDFESLPQIQQDLVSGDINFLQQGIESADILNTVSPRYMEETQTDEFGGELAPFLHKKANVFYGILNGIDYEIFNPETDKNLALNYSLDSVKTGKLTNKKFLREATGLKTGNQMLIGLVTRIDEQKGLDLVVWVAEQILENGEQIILLGVGDQKLEEQFFKLAKNHPYDLAFINKFDIKMASQIYAGADCFLMPSKFEPCGLGQMIAMRYGAIPIVRDVGGLHDTIGDGVTGFKFKDYSSKALIYAIKRAGRIYQDLGKWGKMVESIMGQNFSWDKSAQDYVKLYQRALELKAKSK